MMRKNWQSNKKQTAGATAEERRAAERYPFSASAELVHLEVNARLNVRVSDLGPRGCYLDTINPFPVGANVKIRIVKGNLSFAAQGRVLYSAPGMGMGVEFTAIEPDRSHVLEEWLRELRGESPSPVIGPEESFVEPDEPRPGSDSKYVLNELIGLLIRKRVLTESEGHMLSKRLLG